MFGYTVSTTATPSDETYVREHISPGWCGVTTFSRGALVWCRCEQVAGNVLATGATEGEAWKAARERIGG